MRISTIDIGGTYIKSGVFKDGGIYHTRTTPTESKKGASCIMNTVCKLIDSHGAIDAIGISTRGQVDSSHGVIVFDTPDVIPDYTGTPIKQLIERRFSVPVVVENDVNCAAIGEGTYGAAIKYGDFLCLTFGTSIGGAIVMQRQLYHGSSHSAGEFGMMTFPDLNNSDKFFTYENYASVIALVNMAKEYDISLTDGRKIMDAIQDPFVSKIVDLWCARVSFGICSLIHIFNPPCIILGGGIMEQAEIINRIRKTTLSSIALGFEKVELLPAKLGNTAGMFGAAHLVESSALRG